MLGPALAHLLWCCSGAATLVEKVLNMSPDLKLSINEKNNHVKLKWYLKLGVNDDWRILIAIELSKNFKIDSKLCHNLC